MWGRVTNSSFAALACVFMSLLALPVCAETIASVTELSYDANLRPQCTALRMNTATFGDAPSDACLLKTAGSDGPDRITKTVYDAAGQVIEVKRAVGTDNEQIYATYGYTKNGLKAYEADANGNLTRLVYDGFDRLVNVYYPSTSTTHTIQPCGATPEAFPATSDCGAAYTARDSNNGKIPPLGSWNSADYEAFAYDANGNRTYYRRRSGQQLSTCYDALNRTIIAYAHVQSDCTMTGGVGDVYTSYDLQGHVLSKRFGSFSGSGVVYAYDALGRVKTTTDMNNREVGYKYNAASARTLMTLPNGHSLSFTNDNLNRLNMVTDSSEGVLFSQAYYSTGERRKLMRGGTISSAEDPTTCVSQDNVTCYTYDGLGRLTGLNNDLAGSDRDIGWTFGARNPANQITSWNASNAAYDYFSNARTEDVAPNGLNQDARIAGLTTGCGAAGAGYDCNGNLTNEGLGGRAMTYDVYNRLLTVTGPSINVALTYDPEGRLASYSSNGGASTKSFFYDGTNLIGEYSGASLLRSYVHGTGVDEPIVWFEGGSKRYFVQNYQGSVIGYTDSSGSLQELYRYGPWGEPKNPAGMDSWGGSPFRYTGQITLSDARLYYYKARVYDPISGRFLQTDPIGSKDDLDLYAYVGGDPINATDPDGQQTMPGSGYVNPASLPSEEQYKQVHDTIADHPAETMEIVGAIVQVFSALALQPEGVIVGKGIQNAGTATRLAEGTAVPATQKAPPNPDGPRGAPDHVADVRGPGRDQALAQAKPGETVLTEQRVQGYPGLNRRPDNQIVGIDGKTRLTIESERRPNGAYHKKRVKEYKCAGIECQTRPLKK
jgi:RHS repeat-associated protein